MWLSGQDSEGEEREWEDSLSRFSSSLEQDCAEQQQKICKKKWKKKGVNGRVNE